MQARALVAAFLAVLAAAATAVAAGRGSHTYAIPGQRISFSLPAAWKAVDAKHVLDSAELQKLEQENPQLGSILAAANTPSSPVKFFAFDPVVRQGFATNANVVVSALPMRIGFGVYASALAAEIRSLSSVSQVRTQRVTLGGRPAVRLTYRIRVTANGRSFQTATLQYAFLRRAESIVFTYTTLPQLQTRYAASFDASARSIRIR